MKQKATEAIEAWFQGELTDAELGEVLSEKQFRTLQKRVMDAVAAKMLANPGKITFAEHRTMQ